MSHHEEPDRLNQSWSESAPRYSENSALSTQLQRYARGSYSHGKGWLGKITCQIVFTLFFMVPGVLFILMGFKSGWLPGILGLVPIGIGALLSCFIWKK